MFLKKNFSEIVQIFMLMSLIDTIIKNNWYCSYQFSLWDGIVNNQKLGFFICQKPS